MKRLPHVASRFALGAAATVAVITGGAGVAHAAPGSHSAPAQADSTGQSQPVRGGRIDVQCVLSSNLTESSCKASADLPAVGNVTADSKCLFPTSSGGATDPGSSSGACKLVEVD